MFLTRYSVLAAAAVLVVAPVALAATMDFDTVAVGTVYGASAGDLPGDVVLTQDDIQMSVEDFFITASSFTGFVEATIVGSTASVFPTQSLSINNISAKFDLNAVPFPVGYVFLRYVDLGGEENLAVNGGTLHEVAALSAVPVAVAPGVTASILETPTSGGVTGEIVLTGPVTSFTIGGQEFGIDDVIVLQDPPDDPNDPSDDPNDPLDDPNDPQGDHNGSDGDQGDHDGPDGNPDDPHDPMDGSEDGGPPLGGFADITFNCGGLPGVMMTLCALVALRFSSGRRSW